MLEGLYIGFKKFFASITTILKILVLSRKGPKTELLKNCEDCIILGNGPSLSESITGHPGLFENKDAVCVNFFALSDFYADIKPLHYLINAPEIWFPDIPHDRRKRYTELFSDIFTKTRWPLLLHLPCPARKSAFFKEQVGPALEKNEHVSLRLYNQTPVEGFRTFRFWMFRLNLGMPRPYNVLIPSILYCINNGYKNIFLVGADHSWLKEITVDDQNRVLVRQKHFYDADQSTPKTMFSKGNGQKKLHEVLMKFACSFQAYFTLRDYANLKNTRIINATPGSFIDAFVRYKY